MDRDVGLAHRYLKDTRSLAIDLDDLLWREFSEEFTAPCVADCDLPTSIAIAFSDHHQIKWTVAGEPQFFGATKEQGAFAAKVFRIAETINLVRTIRDDAFPTVCVQTLEHFGRSVMRVRSEVTHSSPNLGSIRNELLGQLESLENTIKLQSLMFGPPQVGAGVESNATDADSGAAAKRQVEQSHGVTEQRWSLNVHMVHLMEKHKEACRSWSVEQWRLELTPSWGKAPSKSGVNGTATWKYLMSLRKEAGAELREKQTARDQAGKRRSTAF